MDKWRVKTSSLKGFEVGDVVKKIQPTNRFPELVCVIAESIGYLGRISFDADLIDLKPEWFEKVQEDIYVWCICNPLDANKSWLYTYRTTKGFLKNHFQSAIFEQTNLFSKKIQKYKLVPVNEDD